MRTENLNPHVMVMKSAEARHLPSIIDDFQFWPDAKNGPCRVTDRVVTLNVRFVAHDPRDLS